MLCEDLADVLTQQFVFLETDQVDIYQKSDRHYISYKKRP